MDFGGFCSSVPAVTWFTLLAVVWTMPWKGVALWRAAGNKHLWWFIAIFLLNTLAILEIIYIFAFSRKKQVAPS